MTVGLDPEWIAANATVDGYRAESAGFVGFIGTGQMSRNARFRLHWAECDGPESVVVKLPSSEAATRAVSFDHDVYLRECVFYRDVASLVDVCVPRALAVHYDAGARDFAILLEDLDGSAQGDQFTEPSDDELQLGIEQCAALHAPLWGQVGDPLLDPFPGGHRHPSRTVRGIDAGLHRNRVRPPGSRARGRHRRRVGTIRSARGRLDPGHGPADHHHPWRLPARQPAVLAIANQLPVAVDAARRPTLRAGCGFFRG